MQNKIIRHILFPFALAAISMAAQAQIGYQVSLLNTATGEPRANVTVNAQVTITDSQDNTIYTGSQQATTNDFGVLSLAVGDAFTFANADTGKMPFFISVSVDGTLIGRSQILNVPVAEVANRVKSSFTKEDLVGTWKYVDAYGHTDFYTFNQDGTAIYIYDAEAPYIRQGEYIIEGDNIHVFLLDTWDTGHVEWSHHIGRFYKSKLIFDSGEFTKQ